MTERAEYRFTVKELGNGTPFLMLEPMRANLSLLSKGFLSLDLAEGITYDEAHEIARYLNDRIRSVAYTR